MSTSRGKVQSPQYANDVSFILDRFDNKGPVEIEEDLKVLDPQDLEDINTIVERLSMIPDLND